MVCLGAFLPSTGSKNLYAAPTLSLELDFDVLSQFFSKEFNFTADDAVDFCQGRQGHLKKNKPTFQIMIMQKEATPKTIQCYE